MMPKIKATIESRVARGFMIAGENLVKVDPYFFSEVEQLCTKSAKRK